MGKLLKWSEAGSGGIFQCVYEIMMCERPASFARNVKGYFLSVCVLFSLSTNRLTERTTRRTGE